MVKLRTALVLLLCASVGVHAGFTDRFNLASLVKMTPQGGLVNTWLYKKDGNVLCINTTSATDPCTDTIDMAGETDISLGFLPSDDVSIKDGGTSAMKVTVTPKAGSSGIMASNSRAADLLNHDKDPMKTIIAGGKLKSVSYAVYATVRIARDKVIRFEKFHKKKNKKLIHKGKICYFKLSLCYGVSFTSTDDTLTPQGSECSSVKSFRVDECKPGWLKDDQPYFIVGSVEKHRRRCNSAVMFSLEQAASMRV